MTPAITCRNVTKDFGSEGALVKALRGVDLDVYPGEITLLVGPSGCGKTTLLSVIAGILRPTAGKLHVLGADLAMLGGNRLVKFRGQNIGFVFQQFNLLPALTAAENVTVPLIVAGWPRRKALARAHALLEEMGMGDRCHHLPSKLSGGEQQRVAIARALIHGPKLLVCDEPTSALDARAGRAIMELLRTVALENGRAVVVVTHDSRVFEFGDRIARMEDGRITEIETSATAWSLEVLQAVA
ncbi:MAG: ABC transporter ATP-binding protein [Planctomycetia bacterium 21-64-5]|nr:MAG: ABC transporter ATP-binding protein [Planctomycetia bacterium 21-64-5]HQU41192.1 ABC transporter ATP-binding protein [Pirellulales bacterium]